jgi:hypothetical protein
MDLGSSNRLSDSCGALKTRFTRYTAVDNLSTVSGWSLPYRSTDGKTQQVRSYPMRLQRCLDRLRFGVYRAQRLPFEWRPPPLGLRAQPPGKPTQPNEDKFFFNAWIHSASRFTGCKSPGKICAL